MSRPTAARVALSWCRCKRADGADHNGVAAALSAATHGTPGRSPSRGTGAGQRESSGRWGALRTASSRAGRAGWEPMGTPAHPGPAVRSRQTQSASAIRRFFRSKSPAPSSSRRSRSYLRAERDQPGVCPRGTCLQQQQATSRGAQINLARHGGTLRATTGSRAMRTGVLR